MSIEFRPNGDGTYDCYVMMGRMDTEFAADFMHGEKGQSLLGLIRRSKLAVRTVRFVLAGSLALAVPLAKVAAGEPEARYAMSYVYFGSSQTQANNVLRAKDTLSVVSPSYFDLNADGSLKRSNISRDFIRTMHQNGIRVVPFLSNHWDRTSGVNALSNVDRLAAQLADTINDYGLDGVNVDIENVTESSGRSIQNWCAACASRFPAIKRYPLPWRRIRVVGTPAGTAHTTMRNWESTPTICLLWRMTSTIRAARPARSPATALYSAQLNTRCAMFPLIKSCSEFRFSGVCGTAKEV